MLGHFPGSGKIRKFRFLFMRRSPPLSSRFAIIALGLGALAMFIILFPPFGIGLRRSTDAEVAGIREREKEGPIVHFTDVTTAAGITFVHNNGAYGDKLLPETMGSGAAFFDADGDGDQDLLFANGTYWPDHVPSGAQPTTPALYLNDGHGHFTDATHGSGLDVSLYGTGIATGDYDNDGRTDIYLTAVGGNRLLHNEGNAKFSDLTEPGGVGAGSWSTSAAWIDYDNDGDLDLFVCNYVQWSKEIDFEANYQLPGIGRAYGPPMNFPGTFPLLYRNDGSGRFTDVSAASGIQIKHPATGVPAAKSLGVAPVDIDSDGWIDLVVSNDTVQNFVFQNQKNGTFKEVGAASGIAFDAYGQTRGAMGIDAARFRNDQALGIAIGNFANEMNAFYVSQRDTLMFADEAIAAGVGPASRALLKFGLFFFDYDLDGRLDVLTANGHLEEEIAQVQPGQQYLQPAQLFWHRRAGDKMNFVSVSPERSGNDIFTPLAGRGSAFGDLDADGDLDVVLTQVAERRSFSGTISNSTTIGCGFASSAPEATATRSARGSKYAPLGRRCRAR